MTRRKIAVIGTGGTISSMATDSLDSLNYPDFGTKLDVAAVLARTPETQIVAEPVAIPFRSVGSTAIGPADWLELRTLIHATAAAQPDIAGFVITHGTATLEETAGAGNDTAPILYTESKLGPPQISSGKPEHAMLHS